MRGTVEKFGDDLVALIPDTLLTQLGAHVGDRMDVCVESGKIVIKPVADGGVEAQPQEGETGFDAGGNKC